jgi:hypothetical protein
VEERREGSGDAGDAGGDGDDGDEVSITGNKAFALYSASLCRPRRNLSPLEGLPSHGPSPTRISKRVW